MPEPNKYIENFSQLQRERYSLDQQIYSLKYFLDVQYYCYNFDSNLKHLDNTGKIISTMSSALLKYYLWSNGTRSFKFIYKNSVDQSDLADNKDFSDGVTGCIKSILDNNTTNFDVSLAQVINDWNDYGIGFMTLEEDDETLFRFGTSDIINTYIDLDYKQRPLFFYIKHYFTVTQVLTKWGKSEKYSDHLKSLINENKMSSVVTFLHIIAPRNNNLKKFKYKNNLSDKKNINESNFKSIWLELEQDNSDFGNIIEEGGFWELPIYMARHNTRTGNKYGEGAGLDALPEILALQEYQREFKHTRDRLIEPALWIRDSSILGSNYLRTHPEAINEINAGLSGVSGSDLMGIVPNNAAQAISIFPGSIEMSKQAIRQAYFIDRLAQLSSTPGTTATEVLEIRANRVAFFSSHRSEIYDQLLSPILKRCFNIAWRKGIIQQYLEDRNILIPYRFQIDNEKILDFHISFDTNATADEKLQQSTNIQGFLQQTGQIKAVFPEQAREVDDQFDISKISRTLLDIFNLPQETARSFNEIIQLQLARQQQQAQQQADAQQQELINNSMQQQAV